MFIFSKDWCLQRRPLVNAYKQEHIVLSASPVFNLYSRKESQTFFLLQAVLVDRNMKCFT